MLRLTQQRHAPGKPENAGLNFQFDQSCEAVHGESLNLARAGANDVADDGRTPSRFGGLARPNSLLGVFSNR